MKRNYHTVELDHSKHRRLSLVENVNVADAQAAPPPAEPSQEEETHEAAQDRSGRKLRCVASLAGQAQAQDVYKIGVSAGLTGYAAAVDRAWRDGLEVAAEYVNSKGGIMGRKIQVIVEDNKSEPQEAVIVYRKMISSDKVDIFLSAAASRPATSPPRNSWCGHKSRWCCARSCRRSRSR